MEPDGDGVGGSTHPRRKTRSRRTTRRTTGGPNPVDPGDHRQTCRPRHIRGRRPVCPTRTRVTWVPHWLRVPALGLRRGPGVGRHNYWGDSSTNQGRTSADADGGGDPLAPTTVVGVGTPATTSDNGVCGVTGPSRWKTSPRRRKGTQRLLRHSVSLQFPRVGLFAPISTPRSQALGPTDVRLVVRQVDTPAQARDPTRSPTTGPVRTGNTHQYRSERIDRSQNYLSSREL